MTRLRTSVKRSNPKRTARMRPWIAGVTPGILPGRRFETKLEVPAPTSAKKATAVSLRKCLHWKGRKRSDLVRSKAGVMHSLALRGLIGGGSEGSARFRSGKEISFRL